eukprot:m.87790 g.87790  ORF g.87790 m.87790 type:complete len:868 (+) comp12249_c0_seq2:3-2606(+)
MDNRDGSDNEDGNSVRNLPIISAQLLPDGDEEEEGSEVHYGIETKRNYQRNSTGDVYDYTKHKNNKFRRIRISTEDDDDEDEDEHTTHTFIDEDTKPLLQLRTFELRSRQKKSANKKLESLDYDTCENKIFVKRLQDTSEENQKNRKKENRKEDILQWILFFLVGITTAMIAFFIDYVVHQLMNWKFSNLVESVDYCKDNGCLALSLLYFVLFNVGFVSIAAVLTMIAPVAAGSGIPEIKCYLNGVKLPGVTDFKTMIAKVIGVLFSVSGGMFVGKEGPMIHSGAIVGAGLTQGKSSNKWVNTGLFTLFRNDKAKRDFVSGGAAAGVAAAFGAPLGGVLFSLEEGCSFWNQSLTWRTLFCTMSSAFMLNFLASGFNLHKWGELEAPSLVNFGKFNDEEGHLWNVVDLGVFIVIGALGGLCGALFNFLNEKLTKYRMKYVRTKWQKLAEVILISTVATVIVFIFSMTLGKCRELTPEDMKEEFAKSARSFFCDGENEYNDMATLAFNPQEIAIKTLFHLDGKFSLQTLGFYFVMYFFIACWTYGIAIPSGLFVPCLVTGASFGRLIGTALRIWSPHYSQTRLGTYALVGAASFLGGVVRMTISLTVILIESTNEISLGLPLMVSLMVAKWVGDLFNEGLYDIHIHLRHIPLLEWEPSEEMKQHTAKDIMSRHPVCFYGVEKVKFIVDVLRNHSHNGFPIVRNFSVVEENNELSDRRGKFRGIILRSQLLVLLIERCFGIRRLSSVNARELKQSDFVAHYPLQMGLDDILETLTGNDMELYMDMQPYMALCPYVVWKDSTVSRCFNLFRTMGLRHLVVVEGDNSEVVGIITRKNLAHHSLSEVIDEDEGNEHELSQFASTTSTSINNVL